MKERWALTRVSKATCRVGMPVPLWEGAPCFPSQLLVLAKPATERHSCSFGNVMCIAPCVTWLRGLPTPYFRRVVVGLHSKSPTPITCSRIPRYQTASRYATRPTKCGHHGRATDFIRRPVALLLLKMAPESQLDGRQLLRDSTWGADDSARHTINESRVPTETRKELYEKSALFVLLAA